MASIFEYLCAGIGGLAIGYLIASLLESWLHQRVGHAPAKFVKRWERHPTLWRSRIDTRYAHHVVHHRRSYRHDHVTQFRSDAERERLDLDLAARGACGERIRRSRYGLRLDGGGALAYVLPLLAGVPLLGLAWGRWTMAGACLALLLPPCFSHFVHPYLHLPHEQAVRQAPRAMAWLLQSRYFRAMARHHYLHHRYMAFNYNLLLGGDWLRGCHRAPAERDLADMRQLGLRTD